MRRVANLLADAAARIGGATPQLDAQLLLAHVLGVARGWLLLNADRDVDARGLDDLVNRRVAGEPVAYLIGHAQFWSLDLLVNKDVLIPRPDTETLLEAAIAACTTPPRRILDLGTGSGALLLAALTIWPDATGLGIDDSIPALKVALTNAHALGLLGRTKFQPGFWARAVNEQFDLILANPPYIAVDDPEVAPDVKAHEPHQALFAGADGLAAYRHILPDLPRLLAPNGLAVLEIGHTQAAAVQALAAELCPQLQASVRQDLAQHDRCVMLRMA